jgi:hypothetical protein
MDYREMVASVKLNPRFWLKPALLWICGSAVSCSTFIPAPTPHDALPLTYTTIGASRHPVVRHLTRNAYCPTVKVNGVETSLQTRVSQEDRPQFEVRVCEAVLPQETARVEIEGVAVTLPKSEPRRIVILGDTGCRVKGSSKENIRIQECSNPEAWPFAKIAAQAAALKPDLVIHTGDYLYRESACPTGAKGCEHFPSGDTFGSWDADFFSPARPLLEAAPWIFVRGNHESCSRAGEGFTRFLSPAPFNPVCIEEPEPFLVPFKGIRFAVLDSSQKALTRERLNSLRTLQLSGDVLLTHRPLWGEETVEPLGPVPGVRLVFTGHWHVFHLSTFEDGRAMQVVVGHGGTELHKNPRQTPTGTEVDGTILKESSLIPGFGFAVLERVGQHWELEARDQTGRILMRKKIRITPSL